MLVCVSGTKYGRTFYVRTERCQNCLGHNLFVSESLFVRIIFVTELFCVRIVLCQNRYMSELFCVRTVLCENHFESESKCVRIILHQYVKKCKYVSNA